MKMRTLLVLVSATAIGCGGDDDGGPGTTVDAPPPMVDAVPAPAFRNPVALPDDQLAQRALMLLGAVSNAGPPLCGGCHGLTKQQIRHWRALSDTAMSNCLTDLAVSSPESARRMLDCLRADPTNSNTKLTPHRLGIWATAARLPWFQFTFQTAYGDDAQYERFVDTASMPPDPLGALQQPEFDIVAEYFARGLPLLDQTLPEDPPPETCKEGTSADVTAHINRMATTGWRAVNAASGLNMFGCGSGQTGIACLSNKPRPAQAFGDTRGVGWEVSGSMLRVLDIVNYRSAFWTRSSASGRYIGHGGGGGGGSTILDLQRDVQIGVTAAYDPAFFPDDSGFMFQGGGNNTCRVSILAAATNVSMSEPGCSSLSNVGLYQHVGAALGGGDYFAVSGQFVSDDGGHDPTLGDPAAFFSSSSGAALTPIVYNGTTFTQKPSTVVATPYEGDAVLSPSAQLVVSRVAGPGDRQLGYVLRKITATPNGAGYDITAPEVARYCMSGGKPAFSYDERWMVIHHYISNTDADARDLGFTGVGDPGFAPFAAQGAANVYLIDLRSGAKTRITRMNPGQYALFPHFRSDGWIYMMVRDGARGSEYAVASDAALARE